MLHLLRSRAGRQTEGFVVPLQVLAGERLPQSEGKQQAHIIYMASKQVATIFNIRQKLTRLSHRLFNFFKYSLTNKRKHVLIIGTPSPLNSSVTEKLNSTWDVFHIKEPEGVAFGHQGRHGIEKEYVNRQLNSIIVLPEHKADAEQFSYGFEDEGFITDFIEIYERKMVKNLVAYRLGHKYLSHSGSLILSCGAEDFYRLEEEEKAAEPPSSPPKKYFWSKHTEPSVQLPPTIRVERMVGKAILDAQILYLGVVIGDRDYMDINSQTLVALSQEQAEEDMETVSEYYCQWADERKQFMPGSFALFKKSLADKRRAYVEYK